MRTVFLEADSPLDRHGEEQGLSGGVGPAQKMY